MRQPVAGSALTVKEKKIIKEHGRGNMAGCYSLLSQYMSVLNLQYYHCKHLFVDVSCKPL